VWIETGEFVELHRRAGHDEAAAGIAVGRITGFRVRSEKRDPVMVFQHGGVLKREGVAIETKLGLGGACRRRTDHRDGTKPPNTR
jgi:hypothetical protein